MKITAAIIISIVGGFFFRTPFNTFMHQPSGQMDAVMEEAAEVTIPRGVFGTNPKNAPIHESILAHPHLAGGLLSSAWQDVEVSEGEYDWSYLDQELARFKEADKLVILGVSMGGMNTPDWLLDKKVQTFSFKDTNKFHDSFGETLNLPVFWDPVYLDAKEDFIREMAKHLKPYEDQIAVLHAGCVNATTGDWNIPNTPQDIEKWRNLGYSTEKVIEACKGTIDMFMEAFPKAVVFTSVGPVPAELDEKGRKDYVARSFADYASAKYPDRFVVGWGGLSANTPDPDGPRLPVAWDIVKDYRPNTAAQMLWAASDTNSCRMNGGEAPCDAATMLRQAVDAGVKGYQMQFLEIYGGDVRNEELAEVIEYAADLLEE